MSGNEFCAAFSTYELFENKTFVFKYVELYDQVKDENSDHIVL